MCLGNRPCGDGGLASEASLAYPKVCYKSIQIKCQTIGFEFLVVTYLATFAFQGIAVDKDILYIADGHRIRTVDLNTGIISTLVGQTTINWGEEVTSSKPPCIGWRVPIPGKQYLLEII